MGEDDREAGKVGGEVLLTTGSGSDQILDSLEVKGDGSFIVTWTESGDVFGRLYDANTNPLGAEFRINQFVTGTQQYSVVRGDSAGNFVAVWESAGQDGSLNGVYARRFAADGTALGNEFAVPSNTTGDQYGPTLAMDRYGNFVVSWTDGNALDGSAESVWMQRFDANGNRVGSSVLVNQTTSGYQAYSVMDMNADGRLVMAWEGNGPGDTYGVFARLYQLNPVVTEGSTAQFTVVTDPQTAQIAYESGKLDIVKIQTKDVPNIQATALGKEFVSHDDVNISVLISNPVNQTEELAVLRALGFAINRQALTEQVLKGLVKPATTFTPPIAAGYNNAGFSGFGFDVAKAKAELAKSKYKPSEITLNAWASTSQDPRVLEAMVQMWKENLGINVNIQQTQTPANGQLKDAANVLFVAQAANYLGPGAWMDRWPDFLVTAKGSNNVNFHGVEAPGMTQAFDAMHNAGPSDIWSKVMAVENLMFQYPQFIPIHYNRSYWLKKPYVDGGAIGGHWNWDLTRITIRQH